MKFTPLRDRVLALPVEKDVMSESGRLHIPDNAQERDRQSRQAHIIALGSEVEGLEVGDRIIIGKYIGLDVTLDGVELLVVPAEDVLGVVE